METGREGGRKEKKLWALEGGGLDKGVMEGGKIEGETPTPWPACSQDQ